MGSRCTTTPDNFRCSRAVPSPTTRRPRKKPAPRAPSGALDWEIEGWVTSYAAIAAGEMDVVSDTVTRLTGHEPQPPEFLRRPPESYRHLLTA